MKKTKNVANIEGYLYEHALEMRESGPQSKKPGSPYIRGTISVASEDLTNVVKVNFSYVAPTYNNGNPNNTYNLLKNILDGKYQTVMTNGKENALKVRVDSSIGLGEWYDKNDGHLISVIRNEGGFVHQVQGTDKFEPKATFDTDIVITNVKRVDVNEEREIPEHVVVKGGIFGFRGLMPVEFSVYNTKAMNYFEDLNVSNKAPVFTRVQGEQVSRTIVHKVEEESAWGDIVIKETSTSQRDFVITWASSIPYEWDSEETILASEFAEEISKREIYLADLKRQQEERQANQGNAFAGMAANAGSSEYNF